MSGSCFDFVPSEELVDLCNMETEVPDEEQVMLVLRMIGGVPPIEEQRKNISEVIQDFVEGTLVLLAKANARCAIKKCVIGHGGFSRHVHDLLAQRFELIGKGQESKFLAKLFQELSVYLSKPCPFIWGAALSRDGAIELRLNRKSSTLFAPPDFEKIFQNQEGWVIT